MMDSYRCYVYDMIQGELVNNGNQACYAGIAKKYLEFSNITEEEKYIYIKFFKKNETNKYILLLIKLINEITPCEIIEIEKTEYIKFCLLKTYDQSLILLNFIRNLWYSPSDYYSSSDKKPYFISFFEYLQKEKDEDPLVKLTSANKKACTDYNYKGQLGHSNCMKGSMLKIKTVTNLKKFRNASTEMFLTTK